jgi:hypothetical protein
VLPHEHTWGSVERRMRAIGEDHQRSLTAKERHDGH